MLFVPLALSATISIICFSTALSRSCNIALGKIKELIAWMGTNSLFIMATHEYLGIKQIIRYFWDALGFINEKYYVVIEIVILLLIELLLCKFVAPFIEKIVNLIMEKIK